MIEQRLPLAQLHNPLGRHPEGQDLSTDRPGRLSDPRSTGVEVTQHARSLRQILTRRRENEAGPFRAAGTSTREQLSLPRREASKDLFEDGDDQVGDHGNRDPVSGRLRDRRSWGEADGWRGGLAASPGVCTSPRLEVASPGSRPRWREPWGCGDRGSMPAPLEASGNVVHGPGQFSIQGAKGEKTVTDEILLIVLAGAWLFVHVIAHGLTQWVAAGNTWAFGARDDPPRETLLSGRLRRAFANYLETLPAVLVVLIAAELSDRANEFTTYGGWIWFGSRVIYLPAYTSGIRWLRSIVWGVATVAIAMMALGLILGVSE